MGGGEWVWVGEWVGMGGWVHSDASKRSLSLYLSPPFCKGWPCGGLSIVNDLCNVTCNLWFS